MIKDKKGKVDVVGVVIAVILLVALIPIIVTAIAGGQADVCPIGYTLNATADSCWLSTAPNETFQTADPVAGLSATEMTLLGLIALFLVLATVFTVVKSSGLMKKK